MKVVCIKVYKETDVKKKLILMCIASVFVVTAMVGGTLAGFNTSTQTKGVTNISVKALGIEMLGTGDANSKEVIIEKGTPGSEVPLQQSVQNNIKEGYTLYTRVTIDKKWDNSKLDSSKIRLYVGSGENKQELVAGKTINDWIVWYSDAEQVVMYYTKPLLANEQSTDFINSISFETDMNNDYAGANASLAFTADAVQEIAVADAMPSEWGVYPEFDKNGVISKIEE